MQADVVSEEHPHPGLSIPCHLKWGQGQGTFSVLVYKGLNSIMRLDPPDLSASLRLSSSSNHIVIRFLHEGGGGHTR